MEQGFTMIYWGYGKGKSTAAIGMAVRALGQKKRVLFMQFMKGENWTTGEQKMFEQLMRDQATSVGGLVTALAQFEYHKIGKGWVRILGDKKPIEEHEEAAREGLKFVMDIFSNEGTAPRGQATKKSGLATSVVAFDVVILDEVLSAVDSALLSVDDIKELIRTKPTEVHLLMTGHNEYPQLVEVADLVTKFEKIKHPFDKGILAQRGVDF